MYQTFFLSGIFSSKNFDANTPSLWFCLDLLCSLDIELEVELASDLPTANASPGTLCVDELLSVIPKKKHIHKSKFEYILMPKMLLIIIQTYNCKHTDLYLVKGRGKNTQQQQKTTSDSDLKTKIFYF